MEILPRILAFPKDGNIYTEELYREVELRGISVLEGVWSREWLRRNVRRGDLVHVHWPSFLYAEPGSSVRTAVRLAKMFRNFALIGRRGARVCWTAHNLYPHDGGRARLSHRIGRRIMVYHADQVIVHGGSAAALVADEFTIPPERLLIGHHPHWIDRYPNTISRAASRRSLAVAPDEFVYLHLGRCQPYKGLEVLIEAFGSMGAAGRLVIAGKFSSPRYLEHIESMARSNPNIRLVPQSIPDDELQIFLNAADCVVLPYREILTSGTALLALSFGRPVIAPDLGSMRDHVAAGAGILYDPAQTSGLTDALLAIRSGSFDAAAIIAGVRKFSWASMAELLLDARR